MIPGSPAGVQAAASAIQGAVATAAVARQSIETSRSTARGGWSGNAADAFDGSASRTAAAVGQFVTTAGHVASPLRTYAGQLQAAQIEFATAVTPAQQAAAIAHAAAANSAAAAAVTAVETEQEQASALKSAIKIGGRVTGVALGSASTIEKFQAANATKIITRWRNLPWNRGLTPVDLEVADKAAAARLTAAAGRFTLASRVATPIFAGAGQWAADSANPSLTTAQRVGRSVTQGVTVGGASIAASMAAGALVGSVIPGAGTLVGAGVGLVVGIGASWGAGALMDSVNDGMVEWGGNAAQSVSDWAGGAADKAGSFLHSISPW